MRYLGANPVIAGIKGGRSVRETTRDGKWCIYHFFSDLSVLHKFVPDSQKKARVRALQYSRHAGKWNLARILVWECILTTAVSLLGGLLLGILFSKTGEMLLIHMLGGQITLAFSVDGLAAFRTTVLFLVIFALDFARTTGARSGCPIRSGVSACMARQRVKSRQKGICCWRSWEWCFWPEHTTLR